jgi:hypothetical protein
MAARPFAPNTQRDADARTGGSVLQAQSEANRSEARRVGDLAAGRPEIGSPSGLGLVRLRARIAAVRRCSAAGQGPGVGEPHVWVIGASAAASRGRLPFPPRRRMGARPASAPSLGNRACHGGGARDLTAGDVQFRCRSADHLPRLHQWAAAGHVVAAGRQGQHEAAVPAGRGRERSAGDGAGCDRAGQRNRRARCRAADPHERSAHGLPVARVAAAAGQDERRHGEYRDRLPSHLTWTSAPAWRLQSTAWP